MTMKRDLIYVGIRLAYNNCQTWLQIRSHAAHVVKQANINKKNSFIISTNKTRMSFLTLIFSAGILLSSENLWKSGWIYVNLSQYQSANLSQSPVNTNPSLRLSHAAWFLVNFLASSLTPAVDDNKDSSSMKTLGSDNCFNQAEDALTISVVSFSDHSNTWRFLKISLSFKISCLSVTTTSLLRKLFQVSRVRNHKNVPGLYKKKKNSCHWYMCQKMDVCKRKIKAYNETI